VGEDMRLRRGHGQRRCEEWEGREERGWGGGERGVRKGNQVNQTGKRQQNRGKTAACWNRKTKGARPCGGSDFVPEECEDCGRRPNPNKACSLYRCREIVRFAEHAVSRMHRGAAVNTHGAQQIIGVEVPGEVVTLFHFRKKSSRTQQRLGRTEREPHRSGEHGANRSHQLHKRRRMGCERAAVCARCGLQLRLDWR
jgi:hypothetical protein